MPKLPDCSSDGSDITAEETRWLPGHIFQLPPRFIMRLILIILPLVNRLMQQTASSLIFSYIPTLSLLHPAVFRPTSFLCLASVFLKKASADFLLRHDGVMFLWCLKGPSVHHSDKRHESCGGLASPFIFIVSPSNSFFSESFRPILFYYLRLFS